MKLNMVYSTKKDGNMSLKYDKNGTSLQNKINFLKKKQIDFKQTLLMHILFKDVIYEIENEVLDYSQLDVKADCIITTIPNLFLYLPFADCVPLAIFDRKQNILAFAHMGWQSTALDLHLNICNVLHQKYHSYLSDLEVCLGPSIKKESYILKNPAQIQEEKWKPYLTLVDNENYQIDLNGYICDGLRRLGIEKIEISPIDTAKDLNFSSHYRTTYLNLEEEESRIICGAQMSE